MFEKWLFKNINMITFVMLITLFPIIFCIKYDVMTGISSDLLPIYRVVIVIIIYYISIKYLKKWNSQAQLTTRLILPGIIGYFLSVYIYFISIGYLDVLFCNKIFIEGDVVNTKKEWGYRNTKYYANLKLADGTIYTLRISQDQYSKIQAADHVSEERYKGITGNTFYVNLLGYRMP